MKMILIYFMLFASLFANSLKVNVPEVDVSVLVENNQSNYVYEEERGSIYLDFKNKKELQNGFALPLILSNQGSGIFYYLAIFDDDNNHIKSLFLGDRIKILNIYIKNDKILIEFLTYEGKRTKTIFTCKSTKTKEE
jgi:hypothetical protein